MKVEEPGQMIRLRVKEIAEENHISQGLLSRLANIDLKIVRNVLRNPTKANITLDTLDRLAKALKVDPRELIEPVPDE